MTYKTLTSLALDFYSLFDVKPNGDIHSRSEIDSIGPVHRHLQYIANSLNSLVTASNEQSRIIGRTYIIEAVDKLKSRLNTAVDLAYSELTPWDVVFEMEFKFAYLEKWLTSTDYKAFLIEYKASCKELEGIIYKEDYDSPNMKWSVEKSRWQFV